jgi:predicted DNA binding CopG/RHH family protein
MTKKEREWLTVRVDPSLLIKLKMKCILQGMTLQAMITELLKKELER